MPKLAFGTTGIPLDAAVNSAGIPSVGASGKCLVRVGVRETLTAGSNTAWYKAAGSIVPLKALIYGPDTAVNPSADTAISSTYYGPLLTSDIFGMSTTAADGQANKEVYCDIIYL